MDYKSKYLKYKKKYLNLQKLDGGTMDHKNKSEIIYGHQNISNKGTQNCGVYINYKNPDKILLCNYTKLNDDQLDFLNLNNNTNLKIYPIFHRLYHSKDTNEYYYSWEKMDGDLRDFFLKHIPARILKKHKPDVTEKQIKIFTDLIVCKTYQTKLHILNSHDYDDINYTVLGDYYGSTKLLYKKKDEKDIKYKLDIIKMYDNELYDIEFRIMYDILTEIEKQLQDIIKSLSYKRYLMYQNSFYTDDKKFDNIVYKIIEQNGDEYKYEFYFIDPESTLKTTSTFSTQEDIFKGIVDDVSSKYDTFKMSDALPNIYDIFLTNMFDICDCENNHKNTLDQLFIDYLKREKDRTDLKEGEIKINNISITGWDFALKKFNVEKNNVFPLKINTEEELLQFIK
jgi:hypothetical protein